MTRLKLKKNIYFLIMQILRAFFPKMFVRIKYYRIYKKKCNFKEPQTFSEKLIWLWFNDYRNNDVVYRLSDKYLVRDFVEKRGCGKLLNQLYFKTDNIDDVSYDSLPASFALKLSMGWNTNIICNDRNSLSESVLRRTLKRWDKGQLLYDMETARIAGVPIKKIKKYYICEKNLSSNKGKVPSDYKIYCFYGEPKAILYITGRDDKKSGCFMSLNWEKLSDLSANYYKLEEIPERPDSLEEMIEAAKKLSRGFPFVRVDLYDYEGKAIFGEMTFFPSGCIGMQQVSIDGKDMSDYLPINLNGGNVLYDYKSI